LNLDTALMPMHFNGSHNHFARFRKFDCIGEQVHDDLTKPTGITYDQFGQVHAAVV